MGTVDRPLRADAERNRQRILAAAGDVFAERGLHATMDEVAERAGVGVGTVYRRFPSRDELVLTLFEERLEQYAHLAEECLADPDPAAGLFGYLERSLALQAADRGLKELLHAQVHQRGRGDRVRDRILPVLEQLVERAHAAGALRDDVTAGDLPMASVMIGAVADVGHGVAPELWRRCLVLLIDGLRARGEEPTPAPPPLDIATLDRAFASWQPPRR